MSDFAVEKEITNQQCRYIAVRCEGWLYRVLAVRVTEEIARQIGGPWHVAVLSPWKGLHAFQGSNGRTLTAGYVAEKLCPRVPQVDRDQVNALTRTVGIALHRSYLLYEEGT